MTESEQQSIVLAVRDIIGRDARVRLFGSRVDDDARGGDVDLMVETDCVLPDRLQRELRLGVSLERAFGGRRVDVLLVDPSVPLQAVHRAAQRHGVFL